VTITGRAGPRFPTTDQAFQRTFLGYRTGGYGLQNAFVTRLKPDGSGLVFSTYSGTGQMHRDLAVDQHGDIYVAVGGRYREKSPQIPMPDQWLANAFQKRIKGGNDSGIMKISRDGSRVLWATYYGGSADEMGGGTVRVGPNGDVFLADATSSADLPTTSGAYHGSPGSKHDWFVARFSGDGSKLIYGTYVGGSGNEFPGAHNLEVDSEGNAYLAGFTKSKDLPVTQDVFQRHFSGSFITKLSPTGQLLACSYGNGGGAEGIAVDLEGHVVTTGKPRSNDQTVTANAAQRTARRHPDAFVASFSTDLRQLLYASYLGGSGKDGGRAIAVDSEGSIYIVGETDSTDWPIHHATQRRNGGRTDALVAKFQVRDVK
jgi:hypothetical protein